MDFRKGRKGRSEHAKTVIGGIEASSSGPFSKLLSLLAGESTVDATVDEPADPNGRWWLDIVIDGHRQTVVWEASQGFGLFAADVTFGEHPDGVFAQAEDAAARLLQLTTQRSRKNAQSPMSLRDLRHLVGQNQKEVATALRKAQSAISKIETGSDPKLSTIREYISAMGGELEVMVSFPSFKAPIAIGEVVVQSSAPEPSRTVKRGTVRRAA